MPSWIFINFFFFFGYRPFKNAIKSEWTTDKWISNVDNESGAVFKTSEESQATNLSMVKVKGKGVGRGGKTWVWEQGTRPGF